MKYFIKTFGCQMNESDSERIASFFESQGFQEANDIKNADLAIFNTCGVRQTAEDRVYGQVHNLKTWNAKHGTACKIIVTGCLAHRKDFQNRLENYVELLFIRKYLKKLENWVIENSLKNENCKLKILNKSNNKQEDNELCEYFSIQPSYKHKDSAFVPIMTGCNNFCSYCVVPYARGREKSRPAEEIFKEIENLSKNGYKEITLLGQNVNSYFY
nr:radical SAM protein [Patescibacteria group bacterium]